MSNLFTKGCLKGTNVWQGFFPKLSNYRQIILCRWRIFLPYRAQFNFDVHIPLYKRTILLPADDPEAIHPCLINAIALAACSVSGPDLAPYAKILACRTRTYMDEALASVDRLEHFIWASIIAGWYYSRVGLLTLAHSMSTSK